MENKAQDAMMVALAERLAGVVGQVTIRPFVGVTVEPRLRLPTKLFTLDRTTVKGRFVTPVLKLTWPGAEI